MRHERHPDHATRERQQQLKIATVGTGGGVITECHLELIVAPAHQHLMGRRVGIAEAGRAIDLKPEAAGGRLAIAVAEITEPPGIAGPVQELCVFECDLAGFARVDGEHPRADEPLPGELDQRGVTLLPDNRFVDGAGLCGVHRFAAQLLIALPERIARKHRFARQREVVHPLVHDRTVVAEPFFDGDPSDTPGDADLHGAAQALDTPHDVGRNRSNGIYPPLRVEGG